MASAKPDFNALPRGPVEDPLLFVPAAPRRDGIALSPHYSERRAKALCSLQVQVLPGELSVHPGSYRGGKEGDRLAEALGTTAHHGWVCESTGRNTCEARAGLESEVVRADPPE